MSDGNLSLSMADTSIAQASSVRSLPSSQSLLSALKSPLPRFANNKAAPSSPMPHPPRNMSLSAGRLRSAGANAAAPWPPIGLPPRKIISRLGITPRRRASARAMAPAGPNMLYPT